MYWRVLCEPIDAARAAEEGFDGGFVLHRHCDDSGPHLDLRLEQAGYLMGWRIGGTRFEGEPWATLKAPHPLAWLEQDGDAVREDSGHYRWIERSDDVARLVLAGGQGVRALCVERAFSLPADAARLLATALHEARVSAAMAGQLVLDGLSARSRAVERLCGLGRELDGPSFDETLWRKGLDELPLTDIHSHLRTYERRFDERYPPLPVSRPERLAEDGTGRVESALSILRTP